MFFLTTLNGTNSTNSPMIPKPVSQVASTEPRNMAFSSMTGKWASKPKHQNATRVRENQRRHRARTKAYIADMERRLAETQASLHDAQKRNAQLISELERLKRHPTKPYLGGDAGDATACHTPVSSAAMRRHAPPLIPSPSLTPSNHDQLLPSPILPLDPTSPSLQILSLSEHKLQEGTQATELPMTVSAGSKVGGASSARTPPEHDGSSSHMPSFTPSVTGCHSPVTLTTTRSQDDEDLETFQSDCSDLPLPSPGESTIPCKTAYRIIKEQNYDGVDIHAIEGFLAPGFRRATTCEDGCRVESARVFSILDLINH